MNEHMHQKKKHAFNHLYFLEDTTFGKICAQKTTRFTIMSMKFDLSILVGQRFTPRGVHDFDAIVPDISNVFEKNTSSRNIFFGEKTKNDKKIGV
jgi:hypothetical protein